MNLFGCAVGTAIWRVPLARRGSLLAILGVVLAQAVAGHQAAPVNAADDSDKKTIQMLLDRIDRLETRVKQLEDAKTPGSAPSTPTATAPTVKDPSVATAEVTTPPAA
jgi:cell division septum initiation protein DivIVA